GILIGENLDIIVAAHLDTVPPKSTFHFDGEYVYGTGCCDDKASVAAILASLKNINELGYSIALFKDEEEGGTGSKIFIEKYKPKMAIVMEPTSLKIASTHYGSLEITLKAMGVSAHGAYPHMGINAIELCTDVYRKISENKWVTASLQMLKGGSDEFIIPDYCEARIELFFPPEIRAKDVVAYITRVTPHNVLLEFTDVYDGTYSKNVHKILEKALIKAGLNVEYTRMPSWTDALNLRAIGVDVVVWGPGELHLCHTQKERIKIDEVVDATNVLISLNDITKEKEK
ncbi:MAG TPA: M20/M25/M40 family metallo-hydrolase, partial [Euryarchaeota archaeon]|nr:M20/M25/M40 family metallo-hydrolase [Euryarchaeota archaeon]